MFLEERRGASVELRPAQRGEKRRLVQLARQNAEMALEHDRLVAQRTRARRVEALEELRERLNLEALPVRIECFDISNLGESNRVASMVVFEDAVAKRSDYRKFTIRHDRGQDDFASMAEAVGRRFARMSNPTADEFDASFSTCPNLVVIDGGKGQLGAALKAMSEHDLPRVAVIALAKREEEVYLPGRPEPVILERGSAGLQLLQRVPDGMSVEVYEFDPQVGGAVRVSLTYESVGVGKTSGRTDTYRGRFVELVPGKRVVEEDEFETDDPALSGVMRMTIELARENE